ncbi:MAG: hypothetical protein ACJ760_04735 [Thermoleophilaceae bacterium]
MITLGAVNLFVAGLAERAQPDLGAAERALRSLLERLPFFPGRHVETWAAGRAAAAWVAHDARHAEAAGERLVLWSGRPIRWAGEREADGAPGALDGELDGRFAVVRAGTDGVDVETDPMGAYPVYETVAGGVRWVSNNASVLRELRGGTALAVDVLASVLGGGWSLDGDPAWEGVRRVGGAPAIAPARLAELFGGDFDPDRAAALLVAAVRALADWPGRPSVVPVTGGRDSRLVLAAAIAAGIDFEVTTGGDDSSPDVVIGRRLAELAGVRHSLIADDPHGSVWSDWRGAARLLAASQAGTATLADAAGFPMGARDGPLPLWHSGQGGEIARAYYGTGEGLDRDGLAERLTRAFLGRRPGRADVLSGDARASVRGRIDSWVDAQLAAGVQPADVPDAFYLTRRMGTWAGPTHGAVELVRDTTSPLWSARLLPDLLGLPASERARHGFHLRVLERLAPELVDVPFEDGRPWPARESELRRRAAAARTLTRKALAEARRRVRPPAAGAADPFGPILAEVRTTVLDQPQHPAWQVLDRERVESLLSSEPAALDTMSRYYVWRLATVFGGLGG